MKFGESDADRAAMLAKRAIRHLVHYSKLPGVALVHRADTDSGEATFPGQEVYARMATEAGLFLLPVVRQTANRYDHVLFLAKTPDLSDDALLACRQTASRNRHDAGDGAGRA
jgi:hypothetical protein